MNQLDRYIKGKCIECGEEIDLLQVYDRLTSEYITISLPFCTTCKNKNIEKRCTYIDH